MKLPIAQSRRPAAGNRGFTMIEIALCLAIVGFALVSILLVLPSGMDTQSQNRQATIVNQDASVLMEGIRNGERGLDDLTNYVYAITNYWGHYQLGVQTASGKNGYSMAGSSIPNNWPQGSASYPITNGLRIVGLLSTPEYTDTNGAPLDNLFYGGYSNHVVAFVRSFSGLATEKPPQNNEIMREDTFTYRVLCVNAPVVADTNLMLRSGYQRALAANLRELRLFFEWPQRPNGSVGDGRQNFRTSIGGKIFMTNELASLNQRLYFYQAGSFITNAPYPP